VGNVQPGQKVLIVGASGGNGTFAVQIAKSFGAEVTGVCSTRNLDMVRSLGADHVIDYTQDDFANGERRYDLILGAGGYRSIFDYRRALNPEGTYVMVGGAMAQVYEAMILGSLLSMTGSKRLTNLAAESDQEDLAFVGKLIEAGKVVPVIDRRYPLSDVPEALRYYGEGHSRGKVVVTVVQGEE
jgi:NADPH:quinone reductase-like Zn-dependent oxidoreductase